MGEFRVDYSLDPTNTNGYPVYTCERHPKVKWLATSIAKVREVWPKDRPWPYEEGEEWTISDCPACMDERDQASIRDGHAEDRVMRMLRESPIGIEYARVTFSSYQANPASDADRVRNRLRSWIQTMIAGNMTGKRGFILRGSPGTGKTHLCAAAYREFLSAGLNPFYSLGAALFRKLKTGFGSHFDEELNRIMAFNLIIIDDFGIGVEAGQDRRAEEILFEVFDRLHRDHKAWIVSTNLEKNELRELVGERIVDRWEETADAALMKWESYRKLKGVQP